MVVTILEAKICPIGTVVSLDTRVKRAFAYVPGARQYTPAHTLIFPYQYSIPDIIEAFQHAVLASPKVEFGVPDEFPVFKTLQYEKMTYHNTDLTKIRRLKHTVNNIETEVVYGST